ncbi:MAG: uncharacterized protein KVP18_001327 [Porospora cf. gigantea A]|uniref:uncharacterized protein n=1 Tax=Porospora cf. gigantea A TaxID=2853593 RepID=UPI0035599B70|nr:MAG: hypothetical protein KVP18_001327 [Porospora cf. gigantea A]
MFDLPENNRSVELTADLAAQIERTLKLEDFVTFYGLRMKCQSVQPVHRLTNSGAAQVVCAGMQECALVDDELQLCSNFELDALHPDEGSLLQVKASAVAEFPGFTVQSKGTCFQMKLLQSPDINEALERCDGDEQCAGLHVSIEKPRRQIVSTCHKVTQEENERVKSLNVRHSEFCTSGTLSSGERL